MFQRKPSVEQQSAGGRRRSLRASIDLDYLRKVEEEVSQESLLHFCSSSCVYMCAQIVCHIQENVNRSGYDFLVSCVHEYVRPASSFLPDSINLLSILFLLESRTY